jgi:hypothetical protein
MAQVMICSLVRDGMAYIPSFRRQLESLKLCDGERWHLCILEGDSRDGTWDYLAHWASEDSRVTLGRECAGDTAEIEDRAARWARVGNACFDLIPSELRYSHVLWLESDLCFPPELLRRLLSHDVDVVAPMIWLGGNFYDSWGFRDINGRRWSNKPPYHPKYRTMKLMEMGSVGSCVLFRREILDAGIRFKGTYENGLLVGMCQDARAKGFKVFADTSTAILHPVDNWEAQMWRPSDITIVRQNEPPLPLTVKEAEKLGLWINLPTLDSDTMLQGNRTFWRRIYRRYQTNRLRVTVQAGTFPRKHYSMVVHVDPPESICLIPIIRQSLLMALKLKFVRKFFKCKLSIDFVS